jgi:FkbM family methyltransferase
VRPGVTIGNGTVIEANAIITHDINAAGYQPVDDPDNDLPLERLLLEKMPQVHVLNKWRAAKGDEELRLDYPLTPDSLVVDVGGYLGDFADDIVRRYDSRVEVFEPIATFGEQIKSRLNGNPKVKVHDFGLAASTRTERISLASESSSIVRTPDAAELQTIHLRSAREVFERIEGPIALLKINIEGAEFELLEQLLADGFFPRIEHLQIQFHNFVADAVARRRHLRERFRQTHVEQWNFPFIWESWRRVG